MYVKRTDVLESNRLNRVQTLVEVFGLFNFLFEDL